MRTNRKMTNIRKSRTTCSKRGYKKKKKKRRLTVNTRLIVRNIKRSIRRMARRVIRFL